MINRILVVVFGLASLLILNYPLHLSPQAAIRLHRSDTSEEEFAKRRRRLVDDLRAQGIRSRSVLDAILKVPRHRFVPPEFQDLAYKDRPLPIGHDQTISQPFIVAYMTEAAEVKPKEKVLEIGTGSGYQAAVLSLLGKEVYTIEIIPALGERARSRLKELGYGNVHVKVGNGYEGWPEHAPFDAIVVTAAPDKVPQALVDQLAINGKMVIPVGTSNQQMMVVSKTGLGVTRERTIPVRFVPMTGKPAKEKRPEN